MKSQIYTFSRYDLLALSGALTIGSLGRGTAMISEQVSNLPERDKVLDLSGVSSIDSTGLRMLVNLNKKVESWGAKLRLADVPATVADVLSKTKLNSVIESVSTLEPLEKEFAREPFSKFEPYSSDEGILRPVPLLCPICGSDSVSAYIVDPELYTWQWVADDPYPTAFGNESDEPLDVYEHAPAVCLECGMASLDFDEFLLHDQGMELSESSVSPRRIDRLTKSIKGRRQLLGHGDDFDETPYLALRSKWACFHIYQLVEQCARTRDEEKTPMHPFAVGFLSYMQIRFAEKAMNEPLISTCRTWFTQALLSNDLTTSQRAMGLFIVMVAGMNLDKPKESAHAFREFQELMYHMPESVSMPLLNSPHFWFDQAERIWREEISDKSRNLRR